MMPLLSRLRAVVALGPDRWRADCPICDEQLRVSWLPGGGLALACAGGCPGRRIAAALGLTMDALDRAA